MSWKIWILRPKSQSEKMEMTRFVSCVLIEKSTECWSPVDTYVFANNASMNGISKIHGLSIMIGIMRAILVSHSNQQVVRCAGSKLRSTLPFNTSKNMQAQSLRHLLMIHFWFSIQSSTHQMFNLTFNSINQCNRNWHLVFKLFFLKQNRIFHPFTYQYFIDN